MIYADRKPKKEYRSFHNEPTTSEGSLAMVGHHSLTGHHSPQQRHLVGVER